MKINTNIDLVDNRYRVAIRVYDLTSREEDLVEDYGEPLIEVGGNIAGSATREGEQATNVDFDFPQEQRRLITDFPLVKYFDLDDDSDADVQAQVYADEIASRISSAKSTLVANDSNFIGETTVTI